MFLITQIYKLILLWKNILAFFPYLKTNGFNSFLNHKLLLKALLLLMIRSKTGFSIKLYVNTHINVGNTHINIGNTLINIYNTHINVGNTLSWDGFSFSLYQQLIV